MPERGLSWNQTRLVREVKEKPFPPTCLLCPSQSDSCISWDAEVSKDSQTAHAFIYSSLISALWKQCSQRKPVLSVERPRFVTCCKEPGPLITKMQVPKWKLIMIFIHSQWQHIIALNNRKNYSLPFCIKEGAIGLHIIVLNEWKQTKGTAAIY